MGSHKFDICTIGSLTMDQIIDVPRDSCVQREQDGVHDFLKIPLGEKILAPESVACPGGGSANCSTGFSKMGFEVTALGNVGADLNGKIILENLRQNQVCTDFVNICEGQDSATSVILHSWDGKRTVFNKRMEAQKSIDFKNLPDAKALYIGHLYTKFNDQLLVLPEWKKETNGFIAWNPGKTQFSKGLNYFEKFLPCVDMLILNVEEAEYFTGLKSSRVRREDADFLVSGMEVSDYMIHESDFLSDVRPLVDVFLKAGIKTVFITDGNRGTQGFTAQDHLWAPPKSCVRVDTLGAGDGFSVGAVSAALKDKDLKTQMLWGTTNATSVIEHLGAQKGQCRISDMPA